MTEKRIEKRRYCRHFGGGSAYFNASGRMHFFQASACGRDMSHLIPQPKNRPKTTILRTRRPKSTCISAAILTCFAGGRTPESLAMGRPFAVFITRAKDG